MIEMLTGIVKLSGWGDFWNEDRLKASYHPVDSPALTLLFRQQGETMRYVLQKLFSELLRFNHFTVFKWRSLLFLLLHWSRF
jgi:hypothetical protein